MFRLNTKDSALEALLRTAAEPQTTVKPVFVAPVTVKVRIHADILRAWIFERARLSHRPPSSSLSWLPSTSK